MRQRGVIVGVAGAWLVALGTSAFAQDGGAAELPERYPLVYIERPLTLPALMAETSLSAGYWWVSEPEDEEPGTAEAEDFARAGAGARFGITDWWQVSASTYYWLEPDDQWSQLVNLASRARVLDTELLDMAPGADAQLLFDGNRSTEPVAAVFVDAHTRIRFCHRLLRRSALYLGDDLVSFGIGDFRRASIDLNAIWALQMRDHVALRFSWQIFHARLYGETQESHGPSPQEMNLLVSPASWIDIWLGYQLRSLAQGLVAGVAVRF